MAAYSSGPIQRHAGPTGRSMFRFSTRGYVFIGIWIAGLLAAGLFNGVEVTEENQRLYNQGMTKAEVMRDLELEEDTFLAQHRLHEAKTWGWWLGLDRAQDEVVERRRRELAPLQRKYDRLESERQEVLRVARQQVGIWSEYGISAVRHHFWSSMEMAKQGAKRQTWWDAFFIILSDRESTFGEIVMRLFVQFFLNLVLYSIIGAISFMFSVYGVISLFAPSAIEGLAFFVLCAAVAGSVIAAFFAAVVGGVVGIGYGSARLLKNQAERRRLEAARGR